MGWVGYVKGIWGRTVWERERETHATSAVLNPQAGCHVSS
jgi:hypothetical protein